MADQKARQYSNLTLKKLYGLSGNKCAFPDCDIVFLNHEDDTNFSNICHIEDANPNTHKSDRYNPEMTARERADYRNLILLCPIHHIETNDTSVYTVEALREMKRRHETIVRHKLSTTTLIAENPSALNTVISALGHRLFTGMEADETNSAPDPEEKILYNNVVQYKPIIDEYKVFQGRLNKIYREIENQGSTRKEFVLLNIKTAYLREKAKYSDIEEIRKNADKIIENVETRLWEIIENSSNQNSHLPIEAIHISLNAILVDAFMRCNILEEPA